VSSIETGKVLEKDAHKGRRVIPDGVAYETDSVLAQTVNGTASKTPLYHGVQGGKTGTTEDHKDAWFCGFTPTLASCVWLGYPKGEIPMESLPVYGAAFGGDYPAIIWTKFMNAAFQDRPARFPAVNSWPLPNNPVQWKPFTSQFPTYVYTPTCAAGAVSTPTSPCNPPADTKPDTKNGNGNGNGNGGGNGGGSSGGGGGGGGSGPPPST
jgi:membrane peptidoglycan carboxypeptidase